MREMATYHVRPIIHRVAHIAEAYYAPDFLRYPGRNDH